VQKYIKYYISPKILINDYELA